MARTYGGLTLKALLIVWCAISNEYRRPRPLAWTHSRAAPWQNGHRARG